MKIHFEANTVWIFAPKMIQEKNNLWREDSNFICFKVNFHAVISGFRAKIKFGEKVRFFRKVYAASRRLFASLQLLVMSVISTIPNVIFYGVLIWEKTPTLMQTQAFDRILWIFFKFTAWKHTRFSLLFDRDERKKYNLDRSEGTVVHFEVSCTDINFENFEKLKILGFFFAKMKTKFLKNKPI